HRYLVAERGSDTVHLLPTFVSERGRLVPNPEVARLDGPNRRGGNGRRGSDGGRRGHDRHRSRLRTPSRVGVLRGPRAEEMLPAIVFVFSRAGCDQAVQQCLAAGLRLTDTREREQLRAIADAHTGTLAADDLEVLRHAEWLGGLEAGFAAHHAGMVPPM